VTVTVISKQKDLDYKHNLEDYLGICLEGLLEQSFFSKDDYGKTPWRVELDYKGRLDDKGFFSAVSNDNKGFKVLFTPLSLCRRIPSVKNLVDGISHEVVHLAQMMKGDLQQEVGFTVWKGKKYYPVEAEDPLYFSKEHQPWEYEARQFEGQVRKNLFDKNPNIKKLYEEQ
jgi:hypothetical protein